MTSHSTHQRARQVAFLYEEALDRGAYAYALDFEADDETAEVFALATSLLEVEREHRKREWDALECLLACIPPGGTYDEVLFLPRPVMGKAIRAASACGWLREPAPEED